MVIHDSITYMVVIHEPSGTMEWISMVENRKIYPWITRRVVKLIEEFKNRFNYFLLSSISNALSFPSCE